MKNCLSLFFILNLLQSSAVLANNQPSFVDAYLAHCDDCYTNVTIQLYNNTPYNCDLASQSVVYGRVNSETRIPIYLAPGSFNRFTMVESNDDYGASIRLTYSCENNHDITLLSHSNRRHNGNNPIKGVVENATHMQGIITKISKDSPWGYLHGNSSELYWALELTDQ